MSSLKRLRITGLFFACLATMVGLGSEGFYIWKAVEISDCNSENETTGYIPCVDFRNDSDVCYHDELETRTWVGIAEGIVGTIAGVSLIIGFVYIMVPVMWVWVVWALGITGYNAYCIYDYFTTIDENTIDCIDESEFWDLFTEQDYSHFFIMVTTAVCGYGLALCALIPVSALVTRMVGPNSPTMGSYELQERKNG